MAASHPRVSIVIPTYNSGRYLTTTLESVLGQTFRSLEVVAYDDGSKDGTLDALDAYARRDGRLHVIRGAHLGIAGARNAGFAATNPRSEFVTFFDHDDVWEPKALELLVNALDANPAAPVAHGLCRCIDSDGRLIPGDDHADNMRNRRAVVGDRVVPIPATEKTSLGAVLVANYVTTPGASLIRRAAFVASGGFEPSTVPCDDWDMNLRLARLGDFIFVDQLVLNWRRHAGATSNNSTRWRTAYVRTRRRSLSSRENTPAQLRTARVALRAEIIGLQSEALQQLTRGELRLGAKKLARSLLLGAVYAGAPASRWT